MDEVVAGRKVRDAVLELVGVEGVDVGEGGRGAVEAQLGLLLDALAQALAVPPLLPAPEELAARLAKRVEGADHDEGADRARADRRAAQPVEEIVEGGVWAVGTLRDDRLAAFLAEVADVVEADAHGVGHGLDRLV